MNANDSHHRPASVVITIPDPENAPVTSHAEIGGRVEWRCETPHYPKFEIIFENKNPFNDDGTFTATGNIDQPVVCEIKNKGDYTYKIRHHHHKDGAPFEWVCDFRSVPCRGCPP